jgi:type II secretory pathway component GspD/PulD (secretin)
VAATADRGSSLFGSISSLGGSVMDMTGLSSLGSGSNALRIVPEIRSNALFVSGPAEQVQQVEQVLKILDSSELPESLRDRVPRMIPVEHADVSEVAAVVENVYKDYTTAPGAQGKGGPQGQNGNMNPLALLMGGGQPQQDNRPGRGIRMTIGVDTRTNTLVVSADDALFRQVESLVSALDQAALEANRTVRVISLEHANSQIVQQALSSLVGRVKVSSTGGSNSQPNGSGSQRTDGQGGDSNRQPNDDDVRRVFEQRLREQMQQQRGGQGGGNSRGNSGGSSEGRRRFGGGGGGGGFGGRPGGSRGGN